MTPDLFDRLGEPARMREIAGYDILDPGLRAGLDAVAKRSATLLEAPVSLVSVLLDSSQHILGAHGLSGWVAEVQGVPAEWSMCARTVLAGEPFCVTDGREDPEHAGNPFLEMTGLRSYLGMPLVSGGQTIGAHCVVDSRRRIFTDVDLALLRDGAEQAMRLLEEHRTG